VTTLSRWAESAAHDPKKPVGHLADGAEAALTPLNITPEMNALAARYLRRMTLTHDCTAGVWCQDSAAHLAEDGDLLEWLLQLNLRHLPPPPRLVPPGPPQADEDARKAADVYWRRVAEAYLQARKQGPYEVHQRMAALLGEDVPARQMGQWGKNRTGRCKAKGWLKSAPGQGGGSVAGPRLEQARAQDDGGAPP